MKHRQGCFQQWCHWIDARTSEDSPDGRILVHWGDHIRLMEWVNEICFKKKKKKLLTKWCIIIVRRYNERSTRPTCKVGAAMPHVVVIMRTTTCNEASNRECQVPIWESERGEKKKILFVLCRSCWFRNTPILEPTSPVLSKQRRLIGECCLMTFNPAITIEAWREKNWLVEFLSLSLSHSIPLHVSITVAMLSCAHMIQGMPTPRPCAICAAQSAYRSPGWPYSSSSHPYSFSTWTRMISEKSKKGFKDNYKLTTILVLHWMQRKASNNWLNTSSTIA